jgi:hypothetical protein
LLIIIQQDTKNGETAHSLFMDTSSNDRREVYDKNR